MTGFLIHDVIESIARFAVGYNETMRLMQGSEIEGFENGVHVGRYCQGSIEDRCKPQHVGE